ncbi:MAG: SH3 domain-containing protein [Thiolinea sp.]
MRASSFFKTAAAVSVVLFATAAFSTSVQANNEFHQVVDVQADDSLNIRAGAGTDNPVIGSIPANGRTVLTTGNTSQVGSSTWVEVVWLGQIGWVNGRYLATDIAPEIQEQPQRKNPVQVNLPQDAEAHVHPANDCTRTINHTHPNGAASHRHNYSCDRNQTQSTGQAHTHPRNHCTNSITHEHPNGSNEHNHRYACKPAQEMARPKYNPAPKFNPQPKYTIQ